MENLAIKIIQQCENINNLLNTNELEDKIDELMNEYDNKGIEYENCNDAYDCIFNAFTNNRTVTLLDGTEMLLTDLRNECIECKRDNMSKFYYYIPEVNIYICLECGAWLKYHTDLFNEICNEYGTISLLGYEEKLLPISWNDIGVRTYFANGIEYLKNKEDKYYEKMIDADIEDDMENDIEYDDDDDF